MARSSFSGFHSHEVPVSLNFQAKPFSPAILWGKCMGPLLGTVPSKW